MPRTTVATLSRNEYVVKGISGTTAPLPHLLAAFLRAFRRCHGVILHSQPCCTASTSILTRSALARGIGSPGRTTAIASLSSATKLLSSVRADINLHASSGVQSTGMETMPLKRRFQPAHLRSGKLFSNSNRQRHFILHEVSPRRQHRRKGLRSTAHPNRRRLNMRCSRWYHRTSTKRLVPT